jgi:biotin carboxyl carrier protein
MHNYKVQVNGRTYFVSAEQAGKERVRATLDGEIFESESLSDGEFSTWIVRRGDEALHAECRGLQNDRLDVWIDGLPFSTSVQTVVTTGTPGLLERVSGEKFGAQIRALMPGRVTSVLVREGEMVEGGAPLLVLEAMKMLNEITSPFAGRVVRVHVREGETVRKDAILVLVE